VSRDFISLDYSAAGLTRCRIDEEKATKAREEMIRKKVIYGHSVPYRNMCRFNSGVRALNDPVGLPTTVDAEAYRRPFSSFSDIHYWPTMTTIGESNRRSSSSAT
jgi:uncharacterized protein (DUF1684 family)